ncbi:MAG: hypothetical protein JEZ11_19690 [Desulfobacterales bacterium]|nr:hypothetical protein [Desulfobacterales bacterium]
MLDVSISYNRYKFLGHEFLTWLWYRIEKEPDRICGPDKEAATLEIGNRIVIENRQGDDSLETITIKGDDAGLEEGVLSLKKGAMVTELNLIYRSMENEWRFTVKGESLNLSSLKTPETAPAESDSDIEGMVLEKIYLYDKALAVITFLFKQFVELRVSDDWFEQGVEPMRRWISA